MKCSKGHWRIQGAASARPQGSRFFRFDKQIFRNVAALGVGAPLRGRRPLREILDPPLRGYHPAYWNVGWGLYFEWGKINSVHTMISKFILLFYIFDLFYLIIYISENSRKLYVADLANDVHCNFLPEALMNTVSSYEASNWLERISYNFLIWIK